MIMGEGRSNKSSDEMESSSEVEVIDAVVDGEDE
jgi:hypothetical protein